MQKRYLIAAILIVAGALSGAERNVTESGLDWLVRHQEADGHWDARKWDATKKSDIGTTSLALLALLGHANSEKIGQYKQNVQRAVSWLRNVKIQTESNSGPNTLEDPYATMLRAMALCEAASMANVRETREAAQAAVDQLVESSPFQKNSVAGEPGFMIGADADLVTAGRCIFALKSAKIAGLKVSPGAFDALILFLDSVEHKLAATEKDTAPPSEYWLKKDVQKSPDFPVHVLSAIGCLSRQYLGWKKEDLKASIEHYVDQSGMPNLDKNSKNADPVYWDLATNCLFQQGGDAWKNWNTHLMKVLSENQRKDGDETGSWDVSGPASKWGRAGQTALCVLCTETYYIYMPLNP